MSDAYDRGRHFEMVVQRVTRRVLKLEVKRDKQSGAGTHKQDIRAPYGTLPIHIECKDQQTLKPREWWREAATKTVPGQAPVVVFPDNEEVLCIMRYSDLLNFIKEANDWREKADDLESFVVPPTAMPKIRNAASLTIHTEQHTKNIGTDKQGHLVPCPHIKDEYGKCAVKGCRNSRGYRAPKPKSGLSKKK